ncbi:DUF5050 domain-containing protein [Sedimentibacter sp.]|uniref:DUF5050 domain-containing protein n=1 Tax=Sedimentibacter sp. TaxID=1960295 RepID=UPI0028AD4C16|nr:DUF5050 domain-containing protein [Sedimentibacter sp.]
MKNKLKILFIVLILSILLSINAFGSTYVNVTLPEFDVRINGIEIDNRNKEYPLIVYKNITYFPMTYHDSRFLGLETKWDNISGLKINRSNEFSAYVDTYSVVNKEKYTASIPSFKVEVNGKVIDNSKEQYPLLLFRNVTYFPLTWRFAVDEFEWNYNFSKSVGLEISNTYTRKVKIKEVKLPVVERDSFYDSAFTVSGDYFYYEGEKGIIYQSPINNSSQRKAVYELPLWTHGSGETYVMAGLKTIDEKVRLSYHVGGAAMGTDYEIIINEDGTNEIFDQGYSHKIDMGYANVRVDQWAPPFPNNLAIKLSGEHEYRPIGDPKYYYGRVKSGSGGSSPSDDLVLAGYNIYILACDLEDSNLTNGIYKIDINTGETVRLCEESAMKFIYNYDIIYFMDMDGYLYQYNTRVAGSVAERLTDFKVSDFTVLNNIVYYITEESKGLELFKLGEKDSANPGGQVKRIINNHGYLCFIFDKNSTSNYKMMVFDEDGNNVFKTDKNIKHVSINEERLFYIR